MPVSSLHNESPVESRDNEKPRWMRTKTVLTEEKMNLIFY